MILNTGQWTDIPAFFPYLELVKDFGQFWYVTITPYEKDIEPGVPDKSEVIESFKYLSRVVGVQVAKNQKLHDPTSPFLIGGSLPGDKLHIAEQKSWVDNQQELGFE